MWLLACFTAGADGGPWSSRSRHRQQPAVAASQPPAAAAAAGVLLQQQQADSLNAAASTKTIRTGTYVPVQQYIVYTS
jgi:hypothetical protein